MGHNVFANKWEIASASGMNKSIARFPDVCLSPPSPPAGPIPVPYPDTSFSTDLKDGSRTVKLNRKSAALAQQSYYKPSTLGNEAATRSFGASVVTHQITGKTYFQAWSMDVKFEGKNVCRHNDITTSNHGSNPPATPPAPSAETQTFEDAKQAVANGKCPCCGAELHPWQKDEHNNAFTPMKEDDFWQKKIDQVVDPERKMRFQKTFNEMKKRKAESRANNKAGKPSCLNVHKDENSGCAMYFDIPKGAKAYSQNPSSSKTPSQSAKRRFADSDRSSAVAEWEKYNPGQLPIGVTMHHKTPSMAGGCNNPYNVVPDTFLSTDTCRKIEKAQKKLEDINDVI